MLRQLYIRNYALIREVRMEFRDGFAVLTGETGAGKSILLGALGLVLGDRAETAVLRNTEDKCIVEALFHAPHLQYHPRVIEYELEGDAEWCIRREVSATGKSRAFINDTPVSLAQLQSIAETLVDLHRQFDTHALTESDHQRELLDAMAGLATPLKTYRKAYASWQSDLQSLRRLEETQRTLQSEQDYRTHILQELEEASFRPGEIESLEEKVRRGGQSEGLVQAVESAVERMQGDGENVLQQLRRVQQSMVPFEKHEEDIRQWVEKLQGVGLELRELIREMERFATRFQFDPQELLEWQARLSEGFRLLKKHGCKTTEELISLQNHLQEQTGSVRDLDAQINSLRQQVNTAELALRAQAKKLHQSRAAVIPSWVDQINQLLIRVGMPNARFSVELIETDLHYSGTDHCQFLLDANVSSAKGAPNWQPVRKVASGGELSRLMLCLKSLVAGRMELPTLIFDEIDAGISGEAAKQVGHLLRMLGTDRQVICITHQPQVAAKGTAHWHVLKVETGGGLETQVQQLTESQRVEALARMIGGESPTDTARKNARELLDA